VPLQAGIAGQNMCLAANSLGLGSCWSGLCLGLNAMPRFLERLGIKSPWQLGGGIMLGYPAFKQKGMVPRLNRPVTWFRPGQKPQLEA
jgi:nitroreductase